MGLNRIFKLTCLLCIAGVLLFPSCKKDQRTRWDTELLVPIANTNLSLQNIVKDSSLRRNSDSSLTLAYKSTLYQFNIADQIVHIPDTSVGQKFTLDSLKLPNTHIDYISTLGSLANTMLASADPSTHAMGQYILQNAIQGGTGQPVTIPPLSGFAPGTFHFDAAQYFDSAYLTSGEIQVWAVNKLPIPLNGVDCYLRNSNSPDIIATRHIDYLAPNDSVYFAIPVAGTHITSQLDFSIVNLSTPGASNVIIDTTSYFELRMFIFNLHASEAWARFPTQNVVDITGDITQQIADRKLTYIDARRGTLRIFITNSVPQPLYLEYTLVGAYDHQGHALKAYTTVPAAPTGSTVTIDTALDVTGFSINLTGQDGSKFNTYTQRILARIDSTGVTQHITQADSLQIRYELSNIAPNYIKGYAGRDTVSQADSADFSFLNIFKSGTIDLESVSMNFTVENGMGVDGQVRINNLNAISSINHTSVHLNSPTLIGQQLAIHRATDFPLTPAINNFNINSNNSNIKDLLGILPNKMQYDVAVKTNPNGDNHQYRDFAYLESSLKINLNAEIPLSLIANHLTLRDTIGFNLSNTNTNVAGISDGVLNLIAENKFPIEANMSMIVYDSVWHPVDTLVFDTKVQAGDLDGNCRVQQPKRTKIPLYVNEERMDNIKRGRSAVIIADFSTVSNNTQCNGQHLKIYSDYSLGVTFTAKFNYKVNAKF